MNRTTYLANRTSKRLFCGLVFCLVIFTCARARAEDRNDFVAAMNQGKALLENRDSAAAIAAYSRAVQLSPESAPALRNLARAQLLGAKPEAALETLKRAAAGDGESAATQYLLGVTLARMSQFKEAIPHFEAAVRLDPDTAALRYQLANAYEAVGENDKAEQQHRETVRLDPLHTASHYRLATYARKAGDMAEYQRRQREFMRLRRLLGESSRSAEALEACIYTQPEAAEATRDQRAPEKSIEVRFTDASDTMLKDVDTHAAAIAVLEVDNSGRPVFLVIDRAGKAWLLRSGDDGAFHRLEVEIEGNALQEVSQCVVGDFHNEPPEGEKYDPAKHARNDVLLLGPKTARLLLRTGDTRFKDVAAEAGLDGVQARTAVWVDYEHDGDLDLVLGGAGVELWQNARGKFKKVTADSGIPDLGGVNDLAAIDLKADQAVDFIVARGAEPTVVLENQRLGEFATQPDPPGPWPAANKILANDLNNDGRPDALLLADNHAIVMLDRSPQRQRIELDGISAGDANLIDYDNDGWLDACFLGRNRDGEQRGAVRLYRNRGAAGWQDVTAETGLDSVDLSIIRNAIAADADGDGDTDLTLLGEDGRLRLLRNEGGNRHNQLKLRLTTVKTNPTGLGTHIELREGSFWLTRQVSGIPIEIGVGDRTKLQSVQTLWTNGVIDNQLDVEVGRAPLTIEEKNVATGSCPFLYAWDGQGFRFITDLLGNAPIGLPLSREVLLPADPDEIVRIGDASQFPPRDGAYLLQITDEFREVLYLDEAKLMVVDHPASIEVEPTDKLMPPPFPKSEVVGLEPVSLLRRAVSSDGNQRTDALRRMDGVFAPPGLPLPAPYRGMCHPLTLTLEFETLDPREPLVLALTGWLQYGDGSTNIALSQCTDLTIIPPTLEAETRDGTRHPVDLTVGMPAGKTKTILCDLTDRLPGDTARLVLTTTFEIRWDRVALFRPVRLPPEATHILPPAHAELAWRGFSELKARAVGHPTTPDYAKVSSTPPWRTALEGWCTRYGDVRELVHTRDGRLAILNSGDGLELRFDAGTLPPVADGHRRSLFLYSVGWDKDADPNNVTGQVVLPLPGQDHHTGSGEDETDWRLEYNTRWVPWEAFPASAAATTPRD